MPFWYFFPIPVLPKEVTHQSNSVELIKYLAKEGSWVKKGTPVALVENWWAVMQINANGTGILDKTFFKPRVAIRIGDPIAIISADGEAIPYGEPLSVLEIVKLIRQKPVKREPNLNSS